MSPKQGGFLLEWLILSATGLAVGGLAFSFVGPNTWTFSGPQMVLIISWALAGAAIGVIVGAAQWITLHRHLHVTSRWILSAAAGWALAMPIASAIEMPVTTDLGLTVFRIDGSALGWFIVGAVVGFTSSLPQSVVLPIRGIQRIQWIIINSLGWALALAASWVAAVAALCTVVGPVGFASGLIGGAVSGVALLQLLPDAAWQTPRSELGSPSATRAHVEPKVSSIDAALGRTLNRSPNRCARVFYHFPNEAAIESCSNKDLGHMLDVLESRILAAVAGLSDEQMQWRPHRNTYSALDLLWHLARTELPVMKPSSKSEALSGLHEANELVRGFLRDQVDSGERIAWWDGEEISLRSAAWGAIRHRSYHLNQLRQLAQMRQAIGPDGGQSVPVEQTSSSQSTR